MTPASRPTMSSRKRTLLIVFSLLGLGASLAASYVHYNLLTQPGYSSACDFSARVSCTDAYLSPYGSILGVPVALGGVVFFAVVLLLSTVAAAPSSPAREAVPGYIFALSIVGLAVTLYLAWASYFVLKVFCVLCAATYVSVAGIFIVSRAAMTVPLATLPGRAARDSRTLVSSPIALVLALAVAGASAAAIAMFPREAAKADAVPVQIQALSEEQRAQLDAWWKLQPTVTLPVPRASGVKVQIVKFSDYQCPACRAAHETLMAVLSKYDKSAVELVMKHYPLEPECNPAVQGNHFAACEAAAAYVMARGTGRQPALDDWLFANQRTLTRDVVRKAAQDVAGIQDFDARYDSALQEVKADASLGVTLQVQSTPTVYLNGRMIAGASSLLPPAVYVDALIRSELAR